MELNLSQEQVAQINAILNSMPISQLQAVQAIIKIFNDAQGSDDQTSETKQLADTEDASAEA